ETGLLNILNQYGCRTIKPPAEEIEKKAEEKPAPKNGSLDLSSLHKMTFGDPLLMRKIMERFVEDSTNDIQQLLRSLDSSDKDEIALLLHRIAGRTSQFGADELGARFRQEENTVRRDGLPQELQKKKITSYAREI